MSRKFSVRVASFNPPTIRRKKMRVRLKTLIAAASLAVFLFSGSSHVFAQAAKTSQAAQDPDLQAIRDNVLTVKGLKFPKLPPNPNAKTDGLSCCTIGDTRNQDVMWPNYETQGVSPQGKVTHERTDPYSPPSTCWVISTYNLSTNSASGASYNLTAVPSNYSLVTASQYQQTYQDVKNFVLNMNILGKYKIDIIANLQQFTNNYASYAQALSVSHGSLLLYTKLESKGKYGGRSWYNGTVHSNETCCPQEIRDPLALKTALTTWVTNTVNALPNKGHGVKINPRDLKSLSLGASPMDGLRANPEPSPSPTPR
jgi:hypothetical protein